MKTLVPGLVLAVAACGGGGDGGGTELITVGEGATIELGSGTVIEVPANAVTEDTEVTVSLGEVTDFAPLQNSRGQAIVFDPPVSLAVSAAVTIDVEPAPTANDYAALYQFTDGVWIGLDVSTIIDADGRVQSVIDVLRPTAVQILQPDS
jgi:hypothetical protein